MSHVSSAACTVLSCLALSISATAQTLPSSNGPLGIYEGEPLASVGPAHKTHPGLYEVHPSHMMTGMEKYVVQATDQTGVCGLTLVSENTPDDPRGEVSRYGFLGYDFMLDKAYGPGVLTDAVSADAPASAPEGWTGGILANTRSYIKTWGQGSPLAQHLDRVTLSVVATTPQESHVVLSYVFTNHDRCQSIITAETPPS